MQFQFKTHHVTFFPEDQAYFEDKLRHLSVILGSMGGDPDAVKCDVTLDKNKHHAGDRFEAKSHITCAHHGNFHAEVSTDTIKKCADLLHDKLKSQIKTFHDKHMSH